MIVNQIKHLINSVPRTDNVDISLKFVTDEQRFNKAIKDMFGRFYTQKELKQNVIKINYLFNFFYYLKIEKFILFKSI